MRNTASTINIIGIPILLEISEKKTGYGRKSEKNGKFREIRILRKTLKFQKVGKSEEKKKKTGKNDKPKNMGVGKSPFLPWKSVNFN